LAGGPLGDQANGEQGGGGGQREAEKGAGEPATREVGPGQSASEAHRGHFPLPSCTSPATSWRPALDPRSGRASSTRRPSRIETTRWEALATLGSWVTNTIAWPPA